MKGIILAGGLSSRLRPSTLAMGKALLPIYDKPMIFYSISLLISCNIKEIYIVCTNRDYLIYKNLFDKKYDEFGVSINILIEDKPMGSANGLKIVKKENINDDIVLVFSDNLFLSNFLIDIVKKHLLNIDGVTIFAKEVDDPTRFGVIEVDEKDNILDIEEKPLFPKSNLVTTGLMIYSKDVFDKLDNLSLSKRGEYETTDLNKIFLHEKRAKIARLNEECLWLDTGTHDSLLQASQKVKIFEDNYGAYGCIELSLLQSNIISFNKFLDLISQYPDDYRNKVLKRLDFYKSFKN